MNKPITTKKEIVKELASKMPELTANQVDEVISTLYELISERLAAKISVKLTGVGTLSVQYVEGHVARNPGTGETVQIAAHHKVKFIPCKALKNL